MVQEGRQKKNKDAKSEKESVRLFTQTVYLPLLVVGPEADLTLHTVLRSLVPVKPQVSVGFILDSHVEWWIQQDLKRERAFSEKECKI